jgi:hypothetical protein
MHNARDPDVVTAGLRVVSAYTEECGGLVRDFMSPLLDFVLPLFGSANSLEQMVLLLNIFAACARRANEVFFGAADQIAAIVGGILADGGHSVPKLLFFRALRLLPTFRSLFAPNVFKDMVTALLTRLLNEQVYEALDVTDRKAIRKFIHDLLRANDPALGLHASDVVGFLLRVASQPLEELTIPVDDAAESVYLVLSTSIETGTCVCNVQSQIRDIHDAFMTLQLILQTNWLGILQRFDLITPIFAVYSPWLDRRMPTNEFRSRILTIGGLLFQYVDFGDAEAAAFSSSFYNRLIREVPDFLDNIDLFYQVMFVVYTTLFFFARYLPEATAVPVAALRLIAVNFTKLWNEAMDGREADARPLSQIPEPAVNSDIICSRILITVAGAWPALLSEFPVNEFQDLQRTMSNGDVEEPFLKTAAAVAVAVYSPALMTAKLQNTLSLMPLAFRADLPRSAAFWLFLYGVLARAGHLDSSFVAELLGGIVRMCSPGLTTDEKDDVGEVLSTGLLPFLGRYSGAVDCGAAWELFWAVLAQEPKARQLYLSATVACDLEAVFEALPPGALAGERAASLATFIGQLAGAWHPPWDVARLLALRDRALSDGQPPS